MVAIVTGAGLGLFNSSLSALGGQGSVGNTSLGQGNENLFVLNPENNGMQIKAAYLSHNKSLLNGEKPYCVAREGVHNDYSVLKFM